MGSLLTFLIVLSILVLVHELGHFIAAKRAGVWVEEFGLGLPPRIVGKKIGETIFSINLLPFGGFVKLHGESSQSKLKKPTRAFLNKGRKDGISILLSGVLMNFLLAVVAFGIVYSISGIPRESDNVKIVDIAPGSPAQISDLITGEVVRKVAGVKVDSVEKFISLVEKNKGKKTQLILESGNTITVIPREDPPEGEGPLGVAISSIEIYYPPLYQRPFYGIYYGFKDAVFWGKQVAVGIVELVGGLFRGQTPKDLAGPVGIYALTSKVSEVGGLALIHFVGVLSVNLAILNILPFPALDGGRLVFIAIESIFGRRVVPKVESLIHSVGMIILILLLIAITAHDVQRITTAGGLSQFINSVLK